MGGNFKFGPVHLPSGSQGKTKSLWREGRLRTDLHVLCLALQRELQLADDGVLLPQRSVQVVLNILLGPLQVLKGVREMLQLHVFLFDEGVKTLEVRRVKRLSSSLTPEATFV